MKAFITLESLLEYFVFSTETLQHEDDLIAHSKVSKERPQVQRENNIPQFQASPFNFILFSPFSVFTFTFTAIYHFTSCSLTRSSSPLLQVFPAGGEVPCGGALPKKVIPAPSHPFLLPLIRCLIKVDNTNNSLSISLHFPLLTLNSFID